MTINLSKYTLQLQRTPNGIQVFDKLRQKFVAYTPEEDIRQRFVAYLTTDLAFPAGLMNNEVSINQNGIKRRCDTIVFDRNGKPAMVIEFKAPTVQITQDVFNQIYRYNIVLRVKYLIVTNGREIYCCRNDYTNNRCEFIKTIPNYNDLTSKI